MFHYDRLVYGDFLALAHKLLIQEIQNFIQIVYSHKQYLSNYFLITGSLLLG
jgi:hypothetical protein